MTKVQFKIYPPKIQKTRIFLVISTCNFSDNVAFTELICLEIIPLYFYEIKTMVVSIDLY